MYAAALVAAGLIYIFGDKTDAWIMLAVIGLFMGVEFLYG